MNNQMIPHILKENLEEAVRDICSVSVAPASKSKVREIITSLIIKVAECEIERLEGMKKKISLVVVGFDGVTKKGQFSEKGYETLCDEMQKRGHNQAIQDQIDYWVSVKEEIIRNI